MTYCFEQVLLNKFSITQLIQILYIWLTNVLNMLRYETIKLSVELSYQRG